MSGGVGRRNGRTPLNSAGRHQWYCAVKSAPCIGGPARECESIDGVAYRTWNTKKMLTDKPASTHQRECNAHA